MKNAQEVAKDLEKTLRNIVAVGDQTGTPARRLYLILNIADKALIRLEEGLAVDVIDR